VVYLLAFGLAITGYALLDWGHYRVNSQQVSLWYLLTGIDNRQGSNTAPNLGTYQTGPGGYTAMPGKDFWSTTLNKTVGGLPYGQPVSS
jgi:hypothetical protein